MDKLLTAEKHEIDCLKLGRELLSWMETVANIKIKPNVEDRFVLRGSYHILANADAPRVFWHPRFVEQLTQLRGR